MVVLAFGSLVLMPKHKFKIGERLFLARSIDPKMPQGAYVVIKRLPKRVSQKRQLQHAFRQRLLCWIAAGARLRDWWLLMARSDNL